MIKKFKNGNIILKYDCESIDEFYNHQITMNNLYFNQVNGYMYLIDWATYKVYDFSNCYDNILNHLKSIMTLNNNKLKIYPLSKKESLSIINDLSYDY